MIIGFSMFNGSCFDGCIPSRDIYRVEITNSKVDEIKIDTGTNTQTYNTTKQEWGLYTQLQCKFTDSMFEAGNIKLAGMPIEYIRIKKRKSGEMTWQNYKDVPFVQNQVDYKWSDFYARSLSDYDYAITPVSQGIEGVYGTKSISCDYDDIWLLGNNNIQYHLRANLQKGDTQTVSPSSFVEVLGSQYPYEISNGAINYRKGNLRATLVSDNTLINNNGIDRKAEKILKDNLYNFLTNKKPKVYKDSDGDYMIVSVKADSVRLTPNNDLSRQIADISFDFIEVGDVYSVQTLRDCGLLV